MRVCPPAKVIEQVVGEVTALCVQHVPEEFLRLLGNRSEWFSYRHGARHYEIDVLGLAHAQLGERVLVLAAQRLDELVHQRINRRRCAVGEALPGLLRRGQQRSVWLRRRLTADDRLFSVSGTALALRAFARTRRSE